MTEKATMKPINYALVILSLLAMVLLPVPARAAKPELPPPGMANYLVVLWAEGTELPDGTRVKKMEEPDFEKLGGKVLKKTDNRREVQLPKAATKQLRKHASVNYVQRIWMGEPLDDWDERHQPKAGFDVGADADTNLDWIRGYEYDGSGNIKKTTTYGYDGNGNRVPLDQDHYIYDTAGRLIRADVVEKVQNFKYDDFGNLIETQVEGANAIKIPVDLSSNRMVGPEYDAAGNVLTRQGSPAYEYDALNMLTRVRVRPGYSRRMIYDPDDERLGMMVDGDSLSRWTIRDLQGRVIREYRGEGAGMDWWIWQLDEIYADGKLVAGEKQPFWFYEDMVYGGFRHYHLDQIGSVRVVTNDDGESISEHDFYPFGNNKTKTYQEQMNWGDPHIDSMRYAGHWRDFLGMLNVENTDYLDYMHARYYDPNLGRFLSIDPEMDVKRITPNPQMWNRYAYVTNDPLNSTDPTGRSQVDVVYKLVQFVRDGKKIIGFKTLGTLTREQAIAARQSGKSVQVSAKTEEKAQRLANELETAAYPDSPNIHHGRDAHVNNGNQAHVQSDGELGHTYYRSFARQPLRTAATVVGAFIIPFKIDLALLLTEYGLGKAAVWGNEKIDDARKKTLMGGEARGEGAADEIIEGNGNNGGGEGGGGSGGGGGGE